MVSIRQACRKGRFSRSFGGGREGVVVGKVRGGVRERSSRCSWSWVWGFCESSQKR